jgi:oligosaccharide repeat unit polymerase
MPLAYFFGVTISNKLPPVKFSEIEYCSLLKLVTPFCYILLIIFSIRGIDYISAGYSSGIDISVAGPLSTLVLFVGFHYMIFYSYFNIFEKRACILLLFLCSVVLLSMGGRMYVLTVIISLLFFRINFNRYFSKFKLLLFISIVFFILLYVGMWRINTIEANNIIFMFLAESIYISISNFSLIQSGNWTLFNTGVDFLYSFLNIIPSFFMPNKQLLLVSILDANDSIQSPYGGIGIIASSVANFGYVGGLVFIGFVGAILQTLRKSAAQSNVNTAYYCFLVGLLPFVFFRDPYQVQIKLVINGLLLISIYWLLSIRIRFNK